MTAAHAMSGAEAGAGAAGGATGGGASPGGKDEVLDAEFEEVKDKDGRNA